jgi:hypothetical protein
MQGKRFTEEKVLRVQYLLAKTEMTIHEIALRTGASESSIAAINRRFDVRRYNGKRARWEMGSASTAQSSTRVGADTDPDHDRFILRSRTGLAADLRNNIS